MRTPSLHLLKSATALAEAASEAATDAALHRVKVVEAKMSDAV
jgi:hypothetical protein